MRIRDARPEDAADLLDIYRPYVEGTAITFELAVPSLSDFRDRVSATLAAGYPYLVAQEEPVTGVRPPSGAGASPSAPGGRVLGYAYAGVFKGREAYRHSVELSIYVAQEARRGGVGGALYRALEEELVGRGFKNAYACIAIPPLVDGQPVQDPYLDMNSVRFHEHLGFSMVGTFHECAYKFGRYYDMCWMEKMIAPHR